MGLVRDRLFMQRCGLHLPTSEKLGTPVSEKVSALGSQVLAPPTYEHLGMSQLPASPAFQKFGNVSSRFVTSY